MPSPPQRDDEAVARSVLLLERSCPFAERVGGPGQVAHVDFEMLESLRVQVRGNLEQGVERFRRFAVGDDECLHGVVDSFLVVGSVPCADI